MSKPLRKYLFSYEFQCTRWSLEIDAASQIEAVARVRAMADAQYDGEAVFSMPVPLGGFFQRCKSWLSGRCS